LLCQQQHWKQQQQLTMEMPVNNSMQMKQTKQALTAAVHHGDAPHAGTLA
jgi:hypothetical protein